MISSGDELQQRLVPFRRRIRQMLVERMACWGVAIAGMVGIILAILHLLNLLYLPAYVMGGLPILGAAAGAIVGLLRPLPDLAVALTVERRVNLKERISTAVLMNAEAEADPELRALVTRDALHHLAEPQPHRLFQRAVAQHHKITLAAWLLAILLFLLPSITWLQSARTRADRLAMREAGKALQRQAKELREDAALADDEVAKQIARNMQRLGIDMERQRLPKKLAMVKLNDLTAKMNQAMEEIAKRDREAMRKAADALRESAKAQAGKDPGNQQAQQRAAQLEKLAKAMEQGNLDAATQTMHELSNALNSQTLTDQEQAALAKALEQFAQSTSDTTAKELAKAASEAAKELNKGGAQGQQNAAQRLAEAMRNNPEAMKRAQQAMQEARQRLAQANPGQCQGQGQRQGMGQQPGNGQGQGQRQGQGQGQGNGNQRGQGGGGGMGGGGAPGNAYTLNDPPERAGAGYDTRNGQAPDPRAPSYSIDVRGGPDDTTPSRVPYYEVYPDYRKSAESAVETEQVPPDQRERVRDYFNALSPGPSAAPTN